MTNVHWHGQFFLRNHFRLYSRIQASSWFGFPNLWIGKSSDRSHICFLKSSRKRDPSMCFKLKHVNGFALDIFREFYFIINGIVKGLGERRCLINTKWRIGRQVCSFRKNLGYFNLPFSRNESDRLSSDQLLLPPLGRKLVYSGFGVCSSLLFPHVSQCESLYSSLLLFVASWDWSFRRSFQYTLKENNVKI